MLLTVYIILWYSCIIKISCGLILHGSVLSIKSFIDRGYGGGLMLEESFESQAVAVYLLVFYHGCCGTLQSLVPGVDCSGI